MPNIVPAPSKTLSVHQTVGVQKKWSLMKRRGFVQGHSFVSGDGKAVMTGIKSVDLLPGTFAWASQPV